MEYPKDVYDLSDPITRGKAPANERLSYICDRAKDIFGRDPRAGGFSFVGQPSVIDYVVRQLDNRDRLLQKPVVIGQTDADVVGWWVHGGARVPFICSHRARDAQIWCVPDDMKVVATMVDRASASDVRQAIWRGEIRVVS